MARRHAASALTHDVMAGPKATSAVEVPVTAATRLYAIQFRPAVLCGLWHPEPRPVEATGLAAQELRLVGETLFQRLGWFEEMASLHGGLHR